MSYRVDYNPEMKSRYPSPSKMRRKLPIRSLLWSVVVIVGIYIVFSSGALRWLIPGERAVTAAAFDGMVSDIGEGTSLRQAFLNFCREIILNGR